MKLATSPPSKRTICALRAALVLLLGATSLPAPAAPLSDADRAFLDDVINPIRLGERPCSPTRGWANARETTRATPLGQTFRVAPGASEVRRIDIGLQGGGAGWTPDESLVLTVWDSPARRKKLGETKTPHSQRLFEGEVFVFLLRAPVKGLPSAYFELTVQGGDGTIGGIAVSPAKYDGGQGHAGGRPADFDLWFEVLVKVPADPGPLWQAFYDEFNLERDGLGRIREAVALKNWDAAGEALVAYFEAQKHLVPRPDKPRERDPKFDRRPADLLCEGKWVFEANDKKQIIDLGPDWSHYRWWPERGGVGLTRTGLRKVFTAAWNQTGDEKYAKAYVAMLRKFYTDMPSPAKAGAVPREGKIDAAGPGGAEGGSMWNALSIAARLGQTPFYYAPYVDCPAFDRATRLAWFVNLVDMAAVLERQKTGGNWEAQAKTSLMGFAEDYPELKRSKAWMAESLESVVALMHEAIYPDGALNETTTNYHTLSMGRYAGTLESCRKLGTPFPKDAELLIERMYAFTMHGTLPDGSLPIWGDTNPPMECKAILQRGAALFDRDDFRYVASGGKEGKPPAQTSLAFPHSGWFVMRSDWASPAARYLMLHNGPHGAHGHNDILSFILYAYGTNFVIDPGIYIYGTPEAQKLTSAASHNAILLDGQGSARDGGSSRFATLRLMDWFDGTNSGFEKGPKAVHRRRIACVRQAQPPPGLGDYWVLADTVTGGREADQMFHLHPDVKPEADGGARAVRVRAKDGAGLLIQSFAPGAQPPVVEKGMLALGWNEKGEGPVVHVRGSAPRESAWLTLLFPSPAGETPAIVTTTIPRGGGAPLGLRVSGPGRVDEVCFGDGPLRDLAAETPGHPSFAADAVLVRRDCGVVFAYAWVSGRKLATEWKSDAKEKTLAACARPIETLEARRDGNRLVVSTRGQDRSLRVAPLGAAEIVVNDGMPRAVPAGAELVDVFPDAAADDSIGVDDQDPGFEIVNEPKGGTVSSEDAVGGSYHWGFGAPTRNNEVRWHPELPKAGLYEVQVRWPDHAAARAPDAPYNVQFKPGGKFTPPALGGALGAPKLPGGEGGSRPDSPAGVAKQSQPAPSGGRGVDPPPPVGSGGASAAPTPVVRAIDTSKAPDGNVELVVDQTGPAAQWHSLGTYEFEAGRAGWVSVRWHIKDRGPVVLADAVRFVPR